MAGQNPNTDIMVLRNQVRNNAIPHVLFPFLTPREALNLNTVVRVRRPQADYNHCDTTCQSWQPPFAPAPPHNDFETMFTYFLHTHANFQNVHHSNPVHSAQLNNQCANRASYTTPLGPMEPSYCLLPHDHPINNMHAHPNRPHDSNEPLVCGPCKGARRVMWDWRMEKLWHGVCAACRDWVVKNHELGYDGCACLDNHFEQRLHTWPLNNGEALIDHMCHDHDFQYFVNICLDANRELWWRRTQGRVPRRRTGGHGWTRPKGKRIGARGVLRERPTPPQRRADTQEMHDDLRPAAVPTCYCSAKIDARGHARRGVEHRLSPFNEPLSMRVRNCVGCNGFRRRW
jgi:hypothetical protein